MTYQHSLRDTLDGCIFDSDAKPLKRAARPVEEMAAPIVTQNSKVQPHSQQDHSQRDTMFQILDLLRTAGRPLTTVEIAERMGTHGAGVGGRCHRLWQQGRVIRGVNERGTRTWIFASMKRRTPIPLKGAKPKNQNKNRANNRAQEAA